jgi:hypothetical protein
MRNKPLSELTRTVIAAILQPPPPPPSSPPPLRPGCLYLRDDPSWRHGLPTLSCLSEPAGRTLGFTVFPLIPFLWQQLYRSINYAVLDNACHEYLFILEFFQVSAPSSRCRDWRRQVR